MTCLLREAAGITEGKTMALPEEAHIKELVDELAGLCQAILADDICLRSTARRILNDLGKKGTV